MTFLTKICDEFEWLEMAYLLGPEVKGPDD